MSAVHPLAEARAEQEASDLKSKLSQIIYEGIIDRLKQGPIHADDLEPLFAPEVRDVCRRLVGAQFGSLASRHYIHAVEYRKSKVPARKGAKSWVYEFTQLGREKLVWVGSANREGPTPTETPGTLDRRSAPRSQRAESTRVRSSGAADPDERSGASSHAPEPARLFGLDEALERPLNPLTDAEAA